MSQPLGKKLTQHLHSATLTFQDARFWRGCRLVFRMQGTSRALALLFQPAAFVRSFEITQGLSSHVARVVVARGRKMHSACLRDEIIFHVRIDGRRGERAARRPCNHGINFMAVRTRIDGGGTNSTYVGAENAAGTTPEHAMHGGK